MGIKASPDYNFKVKHPKVAEEWHPTKNGELTPSEVPPGSGKKVWWQCKKSKRHEWEAMISNRTKPNGTGCPKCRYLKHAAHQQSMP